MDAFDLEVVGQAVATCVPMEVFRCCCVSTRWRTLWSREDLFFPCFALDLYGRTLRESDCNAIAQRIPVNGTSLDLQFSFCTMNEAGVRALAARVPPGLRGLALNFTGCLIGEGGAQAVAARVPAGLRSLSLNFLGHH